MIETAAFWVVVMARAFSAAEVAVAARAVDQRGPQHGGGRAAPGRSRKHPLAGIAQALGKGAFAGIGGVALGGIAGGPEGDHPRTVHGRIAIPGRELVQRPAAEDRVHPPGQRRQMGEIPPMPGQPVGAGPLATRQRIDRPAVRQQAPEQRTADRAAGAEHQRTTRHGARRRGGRGRGRCGIMGHSISAGVDEPTTFIG